MSMSLMGPAPPPPPHWSPQMVQGSPSNSTVVAAGGGGVVGANASSMAIRHEIQRFESVHPSIYAIYDLIELVPDPLLAQQIREHVVCIEGKTDFTPYHLIRFTGNPSLGMLPS